MDTTENETRWWMKPRGLDPDLDQLMARFPLVDRLRPDAPEDEVDEDESET